jgi:hypothetical protein
MSTAPLLKVYRGRGQEGPPISDSPSPDWTTLELYDRYLMRTWRKGANVGTIAKDRHALQCYRQVTGDPPLRLIVEQLKAIALAKKTRQEGPLAWPVWNREDGIIQYVQTKGPIERIPIWRQFADDLKTAPGRSGRPRAQNTCHNVIAAIQTIWRQFAERPEDEEGLEFWPRAPKIPCPPVTEAEVNDTWRLDELGLILDATRVMRRPDWWEALIVFAYNTGLRIGTLMQLTWSMMDMEEPDWLSVPPAIYKGGEHGIDLPINEHARAAAESVRGSSLLIFARARPWPRCKSGMSRGFGKLKAASGLPPHRLRMFGPHAVRGCTYHEAQKIDHDGAEHFLGHRGGEMGTKSYSNQTEAKLLIANKLPQPRYTHQARLF